MHERSMTVRSKVASAAADDAHVACEHGPTRMLRCSSRTIIVSKYSRVRPHCIAGTLGTLVLMIYYATMDNRAYESRDPPVLRKVSHNSE